MHNFLSFQIENLRSVLEMVYGLLDSILRFALDECRPFLICEIGVYDIVKFRRKFPRQEKCWRDVRKEIFLEKTMAQDHQIVQNLTEPCAMVSRLLSLAAVARC